MRTTSEGEGERHTMRSVLSLNGSDWQIVGLPPTEWVWRKIGEAGIDLDNLSPAIPPWLPATVPGDVVSDLRDAQEIPDPFYGRNSRACEWVSQRDWVYRKEFLAPAEMRGKKRIRLCFEGVDFDCHVFLNGKHIGDHTGMYDPFHWEVTDLLQWDTPNQLVVVIAHAPPEPDNQGQIGWTNQIRLWKARFAMGWDWCTRLIPLGIWQDVTLEADEGVLLEDVWVRHGPLRDAEGNPTEQADILFELRTLADAPHPAWIRIDLTCGDHRQRHVTTYPLSAGQQEGEVSVRVPSPQLWYPNGYGPQPLYTAILSLEDANGTLLDQRTVRFGLREVRFERNEGAPDNALPYLCVVNGVRIFLKGWNWVPIDQLYGRPHTERYQHWIAMAQAAHCNMLRVWGGGLLERKTFYDLCDEKGILVWQEFIQSSSGIDNEPARDEDYLAYVWEQAAKMVIQRRNHPSLVLWCGGNELMTPDWKPLTYAHPAIRILESTVEDFHTDAHFLPTSPSGPVFGASTEHVGQMHDVHGNWKYVGDSEHYRFYNTIDPFLHSEFGVEGAANLEAFSRFLPPESHWPPDSTNPDWVHHGSWWLNRPEVEKLFGPLDNLPDFVNASQWLQAEGLRYAVESNRRRKWRNSGTLPWQFNEAWPNASCTNVLDYYGQPKPAYWLIRNAYAPFLLSAEYAKLQWQPGETFRAMVWLNLSQPLPPDAELAWEWYDALTTSIQPLRAERRLLEAPMEANTARRLTEIAIPLPEMPAVFALRLTLSQGAKTLASNEYLFSTYAESPFTALLHAPKTTLEQVARGQDGRSFLLENSGPIYGLRIRPAQGVAPQPTIGYQMFLPANCTTLVGLTEPGRVIVTAWNAASLEIDTTLTKGDQI